MSHRSASFLAFVTAAFVAARAGAEPPIDLQVTWTAPVCESTPSGAERFHELLALELASQGMRVRVGSIGARLTVTLADCTGSAIDVAYHRAGRAVLRRRLSAASIDAPRALALAVAEFALEAARAAPEPMPPRPQRPPPSPPSPVRLLEIGPALSVYPGPAVVLGGASAGVAIPLVRSLEFGAHAGLGIGGHREPQGTIALGTISVDLALHAMWRPRRRLALGVGPALELGAAWTRGASERADVIAHGGAAALADVAASGLLRGKLGAGFWLSAHVRGGVVLAGLDALAVGRSVTGIRGPSLAASLWLGREL